MRKQRETIMKSHHNLSLHVRDAQLLMLIFKLYSVLTYSVHASKSSFPCLAFTVYCAHQHALYMMCVSQFKLF